MAHLVHTIASELNVRVQQVEATLKLIDEGATVPFIARYRKEITGGLDDTQLRELAQRATYLTELNSRRNTILESIEQQGKLTEALRQQINTAVSKTTLEDLYLPYKPKRRTKGQIAKEAGLAPLAESLFTTPTLDPAIEATAYYNHEAGFADTKAVLDGARAILMEQFAEDAQLLAKLRTYLRHHAHLTSKLVPGMEQAGEKFQDYFNHNEPLSKVPSHRALAMLRGRNEGFLHLSLNADPDQDESLRTSYCTQLIAEHLHFQEQGRAADSWLLGVINWTWRVKLSMSLETELIGQLREQSEQAAIQVFSQNLSDLLMAPPAGMRPTLGLDPGLRTGVKVAVVDQTGKLVDTETIYPHVPRKQWDAALHTLQKLVKKHQIELIAVGNGTASRETDKLAAELISQVKPHHLTKVMVSEAGASVYSASALAAREFPELDVSLRGAASIARRLQDPLAELVKIEPKAIGVGQYQHDVSQSQLARSLNDVVERCVNQVGVNLNTASAPLLEHVAGLTPTLAQNIILMRENLGQFSERKQLLKVPRLGPKAFEQCAGFLRINDGKQPLDASSVHPEAYPLVTKISRQANTQIDQLIGNRQLLSQFSAHTFVDSQFGLPTIMDVLSELEKPGQDPRGEFTNAEFTEGVETIQDLQLAMVLEGVVTNVTHFGAFVDVGVHQDGLVHISALSHKFIEDPRQIVKAGDLVKVKVMSVDAKRKRIALSMRLDDEPQSMIEAETATRPRISKPRPNKAPTPNVGGSAMGDAFAQAQQRRR